MPPSKESKLYQSIFENASDGLIVTDIKTQLVVEANPTACAMHGYTYQEFIGLHRSEIVHPASHSLYLDYLRAVQRRGSHEARLIHIRRDGAQFDVEVRGTSFTYQDRPCLLSGVRDISQRVRAERHLQNRVEARAREQSTLLDISQTLASALELQPGLILDQLRVIVEFTHAGLFVLDDSVLVALALRGPSWQQQEMAFNIRLDSPEDRAALFNNHQPTLIADVWSEEPAARLICSFLGDQAVVLLDAVQSWMWVPMAAKGRFIGVVGVAHTERNYFNVHHAGLALTVANQAAITLINAELYEQARTLAALEERQRLARNLHDAVNQSLFSAGLIAEVLPRLWEKDPQEGHRSLEDLRRLTRGAQADMRLLLAELRPSTLTDAELGDLLRLLGNALAGRTNIPISVSVAGEAKLPADVKVAFYRLCQEGLNNIAKHSGASRVDIQLQDEAGAVELRIRDDGRGFDPQQATPGHYGLSMMRERATAVGATLSITSQPGDGAEIVVRWVETQEKEAG
jgi:PAS domain S-box-containing protein